MENNLSILTDKLCKLLEEEERNKKILMVAFVDYLIAKADDNERKYNDTTKKTKVENCIVEETRL